MKTPMQKLIDALILKENKEDGYILLKPSITIAELELMLEKEKEVMCGIYDDALARVDHNYIGGEGKDYYNETFKTK